VLPTNWKQLGLSDEQKKQVYKIRETYRARIEALDKQLKELRSQEEGELSEVLTKAQRDRLREILLKKLPGEKPTEDAKKTEKKDSDK
jgi:Spy/CpxP family protein refolding chaperone